MNKMILAALTTVFSMNFAHAGSSVTSLACSSESGRTIISGILPGQGEMDVNLNFSIGTAMNILSDNNGAKADVNLNARAQKVSISVKNASMSINIQSIDGATKLSHSSNGTKGEFRALVTGTHPATGEAIPQAIEVRCHVSDEI